MNRRIIAMLIVCLAWACKPNQVDWDEPIDLPSNLVASTELAFDAQLRLIGRPPRAVSPPVFTGQCAGSVRMAWGGDTTNDWYAVWWSIRSDSTADVVVSRSTDGVAWGRAIRVDSMDAGRVGCQRPPPSIAADGGNVHVAYAMAAREGPGIFASHSMDRGMIFHSPVAIVYGERPGLTAIAARGDLVAVAYEDPNSNPQRIGLALSRTMAHNFEWRDLVSPASSSARLPGIAVGDGTIAVTWSRGAATDLPAPRQLRMGEIR